MADLKVIDSHFHVWNLDTQNLPWLDGTDGTITHTYKVEDLEAEYARQAGVEFVGGVYVEVDCADHEAAAWSPASSRDFTRWPRRACPSSPATA